MRACLVISPPTFCSWMADIFSSKSVNPWADTVCALDSRKKSLSDGTGCGVFRQNASRWRWPQAQSVRFSSTPPFGDNWRNQLSSNANLKQLMLLSTGGSKNTLPSILSPYEFVWEIQQKTLLSNVPLSLSLLTLLVQTKGIWFLHVHQSGDSFVHLTQTCFIHFANVAKLGAVASDSELEMIVLAFVSSRLGHCSSL